MRVPTYTTYTTYMQHAHVHKLGTEILPRFVDHCRDVDYGVTLPYLSRERK